MRGCCNAWLLVGWVDGLVGWMVDITWVGWLVGLGGLVDDCSIDW